MTQARFLKMDIEGEEAKMHEHFAEAIEQDEDLIFAVAAHHNRFIGNGELSHVTLTRNLDAYRNLFFRCIHPAHLMMLIAHKNNKSVVNQWQNIEEAAAPY